jgi:hypothetical protein
MTTDDAFAAYWAGRDAIEGDENPHPEASALWRAWRHGYLTEYGERRPMTNAEVEAAFASLNGTSM